jgi:hypothetical protein
MKPLTVFQHNFAAAENLIRLYDLLSGPTVEDGGTKAVIEAARKHLEILDGEQIFYLHNDRIFLVAREAAQVSANFFHEHNLASLLRQAVVAACSALDAYFNDKFRENVLTVLLTKKRYAPEELKKLVMTFDEYLSIESWADPNERLQQILEKNLERRTLSNANGITDMVSILGINDFWEQVGRECGEKPSDLRRNIDEIAARRNDIVHRADRPKEQQEVNGSGLQVINRAWVNHRVQIVKTVVLASEKIIDTEMNALKAQTESMSES